MKKLLIVADYNDADYSKDVVTVDDETFEKFLPLMKAINEFKPYIERSKYGDIATHNWESPREDMGQKNLYETYPQFSKKYINEFKDIFLSGLNNPEADYGGCFHTIVTIQDIVTDELYVSYNYFDMESRYDDKVKAFLKEKQEIWSYTRPSDGKSLGRIPFSEMTSYENELIQKAHNLWQKYQ